MQNQWNIVSLKGVGNVVLSFDPEHKIRTLIGSNGVGKTKCLEALFQALICTNRQFLKQYGNHALPIGWEVMKSASTERGTIFESPSDLSQISSVTRMSAEQHHELPVVFLGASNRSSFRETKKTIELFGNFSERREKYFDDIFMSMHNRSLTTLGMADDARAWFVSRAQSVNPYQKESDNRRVEIDSVLSVLAQIDSRINSASLQVDGSGRVSIEIEGLARELGQLSSGFAALVKTVQAIVSGYANFTNDRNLQNVSGVVLIDEIESHLHVQWQAKIIPLLADAFPNTTFYIATHSPLALAQLKEGDAYLLKRDSDGVVRSQAIDSPNKRAFADVLESAFGIDLNLLKRQSLDADDQLAAKHALLTLLNESGAKQ